MWRQVAVLHGYQGLTLYTRGVRDRGSPNGAVIIMTWVQQGRTLSVRMPHERGACGEDSRFAQFGGPEGPERQVEGVKGDVGRRRREREAFERVD